MKMVFITSLTEKLVGREFEIECYDIEVHGIVDNCPPLFKGPGVITGQKKGAISYRVHNQIEISAEARPIIFKQVKQGEVTQVRIFAKDYDNIHWTGGWSIPNVELSTSGKCIVHGQFDQLATRVQRYEANNLNNITELVFSSIPDLPLTELVEEKILHRGEQIFSRSPYDRHELEFNKSKIHFYSSNSSNLFYVSAENSEKFSAPYVENWIPEALTLITASLTYPRMVVRHFKTDALIFLRNTPSETSSKMLPAIIGFPNLRKELWKIFTTYLDECVRCNQFEQLVTTKIFSEVIIASTGTLQAFVLSLSVCVENLAGQLADEFSIKTLDKEESKALKTYLEQWQGDEDIKNRAIGLLSMLGTRSTSQVLKALKEENVIGNEHIKTWNKIRNSLAHGGIIEFSADEDFWQKRNLLISMVYRLILRKIGYRGLITDHASSDIKSIDFQWERKCPVE
jgi:hypothetical protein